MSKINLFQRNSKKDFTELKGHHPIYTIFEQIINENSLKINNRIDQAFFDFTNYYLKTYNKIDMNYYLNEYNNSLKDFEKNYNLDNLTAIIIYLYLHIKYNESRNDLTENLIKKIEEKGIFNYLYEINLFNDFKFTFALGLLYSITKNNIITKFIDYIQKNIDDINSDRALFILYFYYSRKIAGDNLNNDEEDTAKRIAKKLSVNKDKNWFALLPILLFIDNPEDYFQEIDSSIVNTKWYYMAYGGVMLIEDEYLNTSNLPSFGVMNLLLVFKTLNWDELTYIDPKNKKEFENFLKIKKNGIYSKKDVIFWVFISVFISICITIIIIFGIALFVPNISKYSGIIIPLFFSALLSAIISIFLEIYHRITQKKENNQNKGD